eukprot:CAMPEP_0196998682 /NCGR_PEP_ID=MMETSP1380-20130617/4013_1 /TAXON_ID=5936 /ORGANISM="Euplotes crassus, Strain CT5" /LENGTH=333 /DNA_ID=CAMNT_0042415345 /DNA_START=73 /DNA_END=1074 /DNA_ORIENTATION=+
MTNSACAEANTCLGKLNKAREDSHYSNTLETISTQFSDSSKSSTNAKFSRMVIKKVSTKSSKNSSTCFSQDVEMEIDTANSSDSPMEAEEESVHSKVVSTYGIKLLHNLKKKQVKLTGDFSRHEIKNSHRKQMIVWMDEVLAIFKCPSDTFFMSVHIMDRYFEQTSESLLLNDLHEIGIVSMFIASKYQEVDPLTLDLMIEKVAHGKISSKQLLARERKIASCLKFKFEVPNVLNFMESYHEIYSPKFLSEENVLLGENMVKIAKRSILESKKAFGVLPSKLALYILHKALGGLSELDNKNVLICDYMNFVKNEINSLDHLVAKNTIEVKNFA